MIIISNDCSYYPFYDKLNKKYKYNHPFIGNRQFKEDFINTVTYFKSLNYFNYKCYPENMFSTISNIEPYLRIVIDNKVNVHFIHYEYNNDTAITAYKRRIKRLDINDNNIIFICNENGSCYDCFEELEKLCNYNNYKLIYCQEIQYIHIEQLFDNKILNENILKILHSFRPKELSTYIRK